MQSVGEIILYALDQLQDSVHMASTHIYHKDDSTRKDSYFVEQRVELNLTCGRRI